MTDIRLQILENKASTRGKRQVIALRPMAIDGCIRYRIDMPFKYLSTISKDYNVILSPDVNIDQLYFGDVLFTLQPHKSGVGDIPMWDIAKMNNFKLVTDYNDDIFNIPISNPASLGEDAKTSAREMIEHSDALSCTTTFMRDSIKQFNSNIAVIPNYFDMYNYIDMLVTAEEVEQRNRKSGRVVVGYVGSANHTEDQQAFFDAVVRVMRRHKNVDVASFGFWPERLNSEFGSRVHHSKFCGLHLYHHQFRELGIDILVNPLVENNFNKCKSNIKWLEGSFLGAAVIASPIPSFADLGEEYCRCVPWGETYELVVDAFEAAIERMLACPDERYEMVRASQEFMARAWDISLGWRAWDIYLRKVFAGEPVEGIDFTPREGKAPDALQGGADVCVPRDMYTSWTDAGVACACAGDSGSCAPGLA